MQQRCACCLGAQHPCPAALHAARCSSACRCDQSITHVVTHAVNQLLLIITVHVWMQKASKWAFFTLTWSLPARTGLPTLPARGLAITVAKCKQAGRYSLLPGVFQQGQAFHCLYKAQQQRLQSVNKQAFIHSTNPPQSSHLESSNEDRPSNIACTRLGSSGFRAAGTAQRVD